MWPMDRILSGATSPGHSGPGSDGNKRATLHSPKLQHYWSFTIRLFSVISGHSLGESFPSAEMQSVYSTVPDDCPSFWRDEILSLCREYNHRILSLADRDDTILDCLTV